MFNKKNIAIGLVVLIIVIIAFRKKPNSGGNQNLQNLAPETIVLKRGSSHSAQVKEAQRIINNYYKAIGIREISVDGIFGDDTETGFYDILYQPSGSINELQKGVNKLIKNK